MDDEKYIGAIGKSKETRIASSIFFGEYQEDYVDLEIKITTPSYDAPKIKEYTISLLEETFYKLMSDLRSE